MPNATSIRERPILFSDPMVRAILDGTKTQTRRILSPQPSLAAVDHFRHISIVSATDAWEFQACSSTGGPVDAFRVGRDSVKAEIISPYGAPGDRLWVRETWAWRDDTRVVAYKADGECGAWIGDGGGGRLWLRHGGVIAHGIPPRPESWRGESYGLGYFGGRWRPSIFMPRWASRLTLQVTDVRVERLQDISEEDAIAEGVRRLTGEFDGCYMAGEAMSGTTAVECYARLWDSINAKRAPWDSNPWVWVVAFARSDS